MGLSELHFGFEEAPSEFSRSFVGAPLSAGPMGRDFQALWEFFAALFVDAGSFELLFSYLSSLLEASLSSQLAVGA